VAGFILTRLCLLSTFICAGCTQQHALLTATAEPESFYGSSSSQLVTDNVFVKEEKRSVAREYAVSYSSNTH